MSNQEKDETTNKESIILNILLDDSKESDLDDIDKEIMEMGFLEDDI